MRKALPIGIQTFSEVRNSSSDFLYVDKTESVHLMCRHKGYYFLSRPRRFGKSMLVSTMAALFEGKRDLFEGLYIEEHWDWGKTYPVIRMDMSGINYQSITDVQGQLQNMLAQNCRKFEVPVEALTHAGLGPKLGQLIQLISEKYQQQVVILIDEYDKAIQDTLSKEGELAAEAMEELRGFYSVFKPYDEYIRFCFMTGITKFAGMGLFSGANNFDDITLDPDYASIVGFTQDELEHSFGSYFDGVNMEKVKQWYNGYAYLGEKIYNPFDVLLFLKKKNTFANYWWETGTPGFLLKLFEQQNYRPQELGKMELKETRLKQFTLKNLDLVSLLWQSGYLTITGARQDFLGMTYYQLGVPNLEVQNALNELFFETIVKAPSGDFGIEKGGLALYEKDMEDFEQAIRSLFASIPYENYSKSNIQQFEGYYAAILFTFLSSSGLKVYPEKSIAIGRVDMTIETPDYLYVLEFKVGGEGKALEQIHEKRYYEPYLSDGRKVILIGMDFDAEQKNLGGFEWEELESGLIK
ncbi:ATP-binding protein [Persicobacter diffluens]|uniref:ATPase AAA n=1 Tax=Persicobacter diffluens TaxID=981 RepID=A0AAN4VVJ1_9BACT|nr:ATPase AAA [Persicobacter diffluens]